MSDVLVRGGSIIGLSAALLPARDGHRVTVPGADPDGAPPAASPAAAAAPGSPTPPSGPDRARLMDLLTAA